MRPWLLLLASLHLPVVLAHHPDAPDSARSVEPGKRVIALVPITEPGQLERLKEQHTLWTYLWRQGMARIVTSVDRLPPGAIVEVDATARLRGSPGASTAAKGGSTLQNLFPCYRTVDQTLADLQAIADQHPGLAEWVDYGDSWLKTQGLGGHDLHALILTNQSIAGPKPVLMVMAAMHPRELATAEIAARFAEYLIEGYGIDGDRTALLDHNEIHILPQHNPDGRVRVEQGDLFWRKNVNDQHCAPSPPNHGADLNRNSTTFFGGPHASGNPCAETYRGTAAASEPETVAIEDYLTARFPTPRESPGVFISIHSSGEYVFYPWEGVDDDTVDEAGYRALSQRLAFRNGYAPCQNCCIGPASGTTVDQAYALTGAASLTFEVGTEFQQSCASFESTVWPDNRDALLYAARAARQPFQVSGLPEIQAVQVSYDSAEQTTLQVTVDGGGYFVPDACPLVDPADTIAPSASVIQVRYSLDNPPWLSAGVAMNPTDGTFDSSLETADAVLTPQQVGTGRRLLYLYAEDAMGNPGPVTATFVRVPPLFGSGFEQGN